MSSRTLKDGTTLNFLVHVSDKKSFVLNLRSWKTFLLSDDINKRKENNSSKYIGAEGIALIAESIK